MPVCPVCGTELTNPIKTWSMVVSIARKSERVKLTLGIFRCPQCRRKFRSVIEKERITLKGMAKQIGVIERKLVQILGDLREKIEKLKDERAELLEKIERLKKVGEEKVNKLEKEIVSLREEIENTKEMLIETYDRKRQKQLC